MQAIVQLEQAARANRSNADRIADLIAQFCGSMTFVWVHVIWLGGWILANSLPGLTPFDPFPFTFLTLVSHWKRSFFRPSSSLARTMKRVSANAVISWTCRSIC